MLDRSTLLRLARATELDGVASLRTDVRLAEALSRHPRLTLRDVIFDHLEPDELRDAALRLDVTCSDSGHRSRELFGHLVGWRSFDSARQFARRLWLRETTEWETFCRGDRADGGLPWDVPARPDLAYRDRGWEGWRDWLGPRPLEASTALPRKEHQVSKYRTFGEARRFARSLGLRSTEQWRDFSAGRLFAAVGCRPSDVPGTPQYAYSDDAWAGMVDWLGMEPLSFVDARRFARNLGLRGLDAWERWSRGDLAATHWTRPLDVPGNPTRFYARQWRGRGDFLGTGNVHSKTFRPFEEARAFVRGLGLRSLADWAQWSKGARPDLPARPDDIPACPRTEYLGAGFTTLGDWLGTGTIAPGLREYRTFDDARAFARTLELRGAAEWSAWCQGKLATRADLSPKPPDIPAAPHVIYKDGGWESYGDWLGTGRRRGRGFCSFEAVRAFVRTLRLRTSRDWRDWYRGSRPDLPPCPPDLPGRPDHYYASSGWRSWRDFLAGPAAVG